MRLSPQEIDKLSLHQVGVLAQKRLARGVRLNHPEAIALIATQLLELVRDGRHSVAELMQLGRTLLGRRNVMPGVPALVSEVQVEGTFPDGSKLVTVHQPIVALDGDLRLALYGSFLPVPDAAIFAQEDDADDAPGAYRIEPGELEINTGRRGCTLEVSNTGDRAVQVGSHFPFTDVNAALVFDRVAALGMHLDIPAGTAVRFEPGERRSVALVEIGGRRIVYGGSSLVDGPATDPAKLEERVLARGFGHRRQS